MSYSDWERAYEISMNGWPDPLGDLGGRGGKDHGEGTMFGAVEFLDTCVRTDDGTILPPEISASQADIALAQQVAASELLRDDPQTYHGPDAAAFIAKVAAEMLPPIVEPLSDDSFRKYNW